MFDNLTKSLSYALRKLSGYRYLTEDNIKGTIREVRIALLEADVALPVVIDFINRIKAKTIGHKVNDNFSPSQEFIKIVRDELIYVMGEENKTLNLATQPPAAIITVGLQGSGKTSSIAKLSRFLKEKYSKKVLVVSADVYRPAAIKQLEILAKQANVDFFPSNVALKPINIVNAALKEAKLKFYDVLLIDTAGRLHIDEMMMDEVKNISALVNPIETLFVVDAMTGQDIANVAKIFNKVLSLSGIILTKLDSDTRGGAALSVRHITGKPIKFFSASEKNDVLEPFYPERIASRILGMGDMLSLIEDIESKVNHVQAERLINKLQKGNELNLIDFLEQLKQIKNIGGVSNILSKLPNTEELPDEIRSCMNDNVFIKMEAIINSMTLKERSNPDIIKGSRRRRIANGCGLQVQDVSNLLKQFYDMRRIMKKMKNSKIDKIATSIMRTIASSGKK